MINIKNDNVTVKVGNKEHIFKNLLTDTCLNEYSRQIGGNTPNTDRMTLYKCVIKFAPAENITTASTSMTFDIYVENNPYDPINVEQIKNSNAITTTYKFNFLSTSLEPYIGEQIAGIGFYTEFNTDLMAYVDVTNANIFVVLGQDLIISRTDKITTEDIFYSDILDYPIHLTPENYNGTYSTALYSIGFARELYNIEKEYLYDDITTKHSWEEGSPYETATYYFSPLADEYTGELYPSNDLYPSDSLYPKGLKYKYVVFTYGLYNANDIYQGKKYSIFHLMNEESETRLLVKIKLERGD